MKPFTENELRLLSDCLILAIQSNNDAAKKTVSRKAGEDIAACNRVLQHLNTKVCDMMEEEQ